MSATDECPRERTYVSAQAGLRCDRILAHSCKRVVPRTPQDPSHLREHGAQRPRRVCIPSVAAESSFQETTRNFEVAPRMVQAAALGQDETHLFEDARHWFAL